MIVCRTLLISEVPPHHKLPAIYLLDSICKNVGSPYTLYFARNLYKTFMEVYTVVDAPVRRKLEELFQTWKQPVPGAHSQSPVFSVDATRKIEDALVKMRNVVLQLQRKEQNHSYPQQDPSSRFQQALLPSLPSSSGLFGLTGMVRVNIVPSLLSLSFSLLRIKLIPLLLLCCTIHQLIPQWVNCSETFLVCWMLHTQS